MRVSRAGNIRRQMIVDEVSLYRDRERGGTTGGGRLWLRGGNGAWVNL